MGILFLLLFFFKQDFNCFKNKKPKNQKTKKPKTKNQKPKIKNKKQKTKCGEGVPENRKGLLQMHSTAVEKVLKVLLAY